MKRLLLILSLVASTAFAGTPASEASVKELLAVQNASKAIDSAMSQIDGAINQMIGQMTHGQKPSTEEQAAIDKYIASAKSIMSKELTWAKLEPLYVKIYQESFSQEEVDGVLAFFKTPAGHAYAEKVPVVTQKTMAAMPAIMGPMMQQIQGAAQQLAMDLQAIKSKN